MLLLLLLLILLPSCSHGGGGTNSACIPWRPILVSRADVLTQDTARAILGHNLTGERLCGWTGRAPG
jgi:hypothetical protein